MDASDLQRVAKDGGAMGLSLAAHIGLGILGISLLIAWHEFGHYLVARLFRMRVLRFSIGFGPKLIGFTKNRIEYVLCWIPFGGFVEIAGLGEAPEEVKEDPAAFTNRPLWARFLVVFAGPLFNYVLAFGLFAFLFGTWSFQGLEQSLLVQQVVSGSAAWEAGIVQRDQIIQIDGSAATQAQLFQSAAQSKGKPIRLLLDRFNPGTQETSRLEISVKPQLGDDGMYRLGVMFVPMGISKDTHFAWASAKEVMSQSAGILVQLGNAIFAKSHMQMGGAVELTRQLSMAASLGWSYFLWLLGSLSVMLGLFNLLPIPALDGSKMLLLGVEAAVRRPIPHRVQMVIHGVGIVLILGLMLVLTVLDVMRLYQAG